MIPFHPLADIFPLIEGQDFADLVADVRTHGLREPVILLDRKILDGRNRYRACVAAGLLSESIDTLTAPMVKYFRQYAPPGSAPPPHDELVAFVISKNLRRRQMNDDQRRMVAARLVNLKPGRPSDEQPSQIANISRDSAARLLTSDVAGIDRARTVISHAAPEVIAAVDEGKVSVAAAAELAAQPIERQAEILKNLPRDERGKLTSDVKKALGPVIKEIRAEKQIEKKQRREEKIRELGDKQRALPDEKFGVILADPEWPFDVWSEETGQDRAAANHYPTSTMEVIKSRPVADIAADECVLGLWATVPKLPAALDVMRGWGFTYVSQIVWVKDRIGIGYWFRNNHEILLIGKKGAPPKPADGTQWRSAIEAPRAAHSEKPDFQYEFFETFFAGLPAIELNARRARKGWRAWGLEAPHDPETGEIKEGEAA